MCFHPPLSHFHEIRKYTLRYSQQTLHVIFRFRTCNLVSQVLRNRYRVIVSLLIEVIWMLVLMLRGPLQVSIRYLTSWVHFFIHFHSLLNFFIHSEKLLARAIFFSYYLVCIWIFLNFLLLLEFF
jgi:hypothetical protein